MKEYIWFWTDKIKHTCYIEIIQDQYAIIEDNFIYRFNRLLSALGRGGGYHKFYIIFHEIDGTKFFLKIIHRYKILTFKYTQKWVELYSFIDMSMAFEMLSFDALKFNWFVIYTCILLKDFWLALWPIPFLLQWSWLETAVWVKVISCPDSPETNST